MSILSKINTVHSACKLVQPSHALRLLSNTLLRCFALCACRGGISAVLLMVGLCAAGCGSSAVRRVDSYDTAWRPSALNSRQYMRVAEQATDSCKRDAAQLHAVEQYLWSHQLQQAQSTLEQAIAINYSSSAFDTLAYSVLEARLDFLQGHPKQGLRLLLRQRSMVHKLKREKLIQRRSCEDKVYYYWVLRYYQLFARIYRALGDAMHSAQQYSALAAWMQQNPVAEVRTALHIIRCLRTLTVQQRQRMADQTLDPVWRGWLQFVKIIDGSWVHIMQRRSELIAWHQHYPHHLANRLVNWDALSRIPDAAAERVVKNARTGLPGYVAHRANTRVALLLPLHGQFSAVGQAIYNGFLSAYYSSDPSAALRKLEMHVMDTSSGDIQAHYQKAVQQGADFIIGPLIKSRVQKIVQLDAHPVTTVLLNDSAAENPVKNRSWTFTDKAATKLYQFGLSSTQETADIVTRMWGNGLRHVLVIAMDNAWGRNTVQTFTQRFSNLGGRVVGVAYIAHDARTFSKKIRALLGITHSVSRKVALQQALDEKLRFIARRRTDVDGFLLALSAQQAHQVLPLLPFFYAGNLPVYALSSVYNQHQVLLGSDLDGVLFGGMPWVLHPFVRLPPALHTIYNRATHTWPHNTRRYAKFYAMGADAYRIMLYLPRLKWLPDLPFNGATGALYLRHQHISHHLTWVVMRHGQPVLLANKTL